MHNALLPSAIACGSPGCKHFRKRNACSLLAAAALVSLTTGALAEDASIFSASGFATLGAIYHERDGVEYRRDISNPRGARANRLDFSQDSMLGLQVSARPTEQWQATVQLVSRHAIEIGYRPEVAWGYVKYQPVENVSLRAGRLGIEMYLAGDSSEIGYANLMVRQPTVIYPRAHDGLDGEVVFPTGNGTLRLKSMVGHTLGKMMAGSMPHELDGLVWGALAEYNLNSWTARISAGRLKLANESTPPEAVAIRSAIAMTPNGAAINDTLLLKDRTLHYTSLALGYDNGPLQAQANITRMTSSGWADQDSFFAHIGYRLGSFTPYLGYSITRTDREILPTGIPDGLSAETDALNQASGLTQGMASKFNESDIVIGVRYDFARNAALKIQADRIRYLDPWNTVDPSLNTTSFESRKQQKNLSLLSVALEFVF